MISRWLHGHADKPPYKAPAVLYLGDSRGRTVVQTVAFAQQGERYRQKVH